MKQFGNLPYGFRSNTWVVPPLAADSQSIFPSLPVEDENWGGNGGGQGRDGNRVWSRDFAVVANMPCKTVEERQVRDKKAFLLHSLFVDVAVVKAMSILKSSQTTQLLDSQSYEENDGNLKIVVTRDASNASKKVTVKIDGSELSVPTKNLLKGITADENTTVHVC